MLCQFLLYRSLSSLGLQKWPQFWGLFGSPGEQAALSLLASVWLEEVAMWWPRKRRVWNVDNSSSVTFQLPLRGQIQLFFFFFLILTTTAAAYESSQARGCIQTSAASLHHSHSNTRPEPLLWPMPQLMGNARSLTPWASLGIEPISLRLLCWILNLLSHNGNAGQLPHSVGLSTLSSSFNLESRERSNSPHFSLLGPCLPEHH